MTMKIVDICAVYKEWPVFVVMQTDIGEFLELSLTELKEGNFEFDENAWRQLVDEYRVFHRSPR
jgi:hypothetical protein